tara:strand:- start:2486 stop:3196 length:711 start_codon:yes stop_codon:yes gene_type:complete
MKKMINFAFRLAGRNGYSVDETLTSAEIFFILFSKFTSFLRGLFFGLFFNKRAGLMFIGSGVSIIGWGRIKCGRNFNVENDVTINALAREGVTFGRNVTLRFGSVIECCGVLRSLGEKLVIGDNVGISPYCFISVRGAVEIGDNTILGPSVKIFSENHRFNDTQLPIVHQGEDRKGVVIGENNWIGAQSIILDGVVLGEGCVVAANTVVTKSFANGSIIAGIPGRLIGNRYEKSNS